MSANWCGACICACQDKLQLFDLIIVRGNRLCLLLPMVSATELIDMETEEFSFPRLKTVVLELVSLGQEFCAQVMWLRFFVHGRKIF